MRSLRFFAAIGLLLSLSGCAFFEESQALGCGESVIEKDGSPIGLLVSPGANFATFENSLDSAQVALESLVQSKGALNVSTYVATSTPHLLQIAGIRAAGASSFSLSEHVDSFSRNLRNEYKCAIESDALELNPELDMITALAQSAQATDGNAVSDVIVVSNGIQTAGDLRLQEGFSADPSLQIRNLVANNALPDLRGVHVHWVGIGQTSGDQPTFATASINALKALWTQIIEVSGGQVTFEGNVKLADGNPEGPAVSQVAPLFVAPVVQACRSVLTDENLSFVAGTATFLSPSLAEATFDNLKVQFGSQNCTGTLTIKGFTTNFGSASEQKSIAKSRATAVAAELLKRLPGFKSEVTGVGYDGTGDLDQSNRRVEVSFTD